MNTQLNMTSVTFNSSSKQKQTENVKTNAQKNLNQYVTNLQTYKQNVAGPILYSTNNTDSTDNTNNDNKNNDNKNNNALLHTIFDNGFISAVYQAYCKHHELILKPDNILLAIEMQFSSYLNKYAEELRNNFVNHQGQKELIIKMLTLDWPLFIKLTVKEIQKNIKDNTVCEWLLPNFTTTTEQDETIANIVIMATMQKYFSYTCSLECGIPKVTLLGTLEDWLKLRAKINKLLDYEIKDSKSQQSRGIMKRWHTLLAPILDEFIESYKGNVNLNFWDKICSRIYRGSGSCYLSGWITAFCIFDVDGNEIQSSDRFEMENTFKSQNMENVKDIKDVKNSENAQNSENVKQICYPVIEMDDIPAGFVTVPVKIDDNGREYQTQILAGHFGYKVVNNNALQPRSDFLVGLVDQNKADKYKKTPDITLNDY